MTWSRAAPGWSSPAAGCRCWTTPGFTPAGSPRTTSPTSGMPPLLRVEPEVCPNVTDVDDVLDAAASRASTPYDAFAAIQQYHFEHDLTALSVRPVRHEPRAHRYVEHVIRLASGLMAIGSAYERGGSVYFRAPDVAARAGLDHADALRLAAEYAGRPD